MRLLTFLVLSSTTALMACAPRTIVSQASTPASRGQAMVCNSDSVLLRTPTGVLAASRLCPATPAPWPVALIIAGSGPTDRDGNSNFLPTPNNSLRMLAEALASRGIASLRYDKRGIGASRSAVTSEADLRFDMYADDAAAWVGELQGDSRFTTVTVVGHSEGSLLGMLATQRASADAFVSIAGVGRPAAQVLHEQISGRAPFALVTEADRILALLSDGKTASDVPPTLAPVFRPSMQPYLISWFRYDAATEIRRLRVPVLITQGTTDVQVTVQEARLLSAANPAATLVIVEGMNHVLKLVPAIDAAQLRSYSDPTLPIAVPLVDAIASFVNGVRRR